MSTDLSSDFDCDIISSLEKITFKDGIDQKDTNHIVCAVSQSDDDYQLHTLVNGVSVVCEATVSAEAIFSFSAILELEELSFYEFDNSLKFGDLSDVMVIRPDIIELNSSSLFDEAFWRTQKRHPVCVLSHQYWETFMIPFIP
uniref:Uncharacterized protein n=1 Tax=Hyaloperonospora arabidopsidis (strain Emoy2) TaxID=559515 RepID=M4B4I1_HYAAE